MLFGHSEVHFWSYEGNENGKLKKVSPKGNYKEKANPNSQMNYIVVQSQGGDPPALRLKGGGGPPPTCRARG